MAVTLTADLTEIDDCDSITNWSGSLALTADTSTYREGTGSIGLTKASQATVYWQYDYYTDHASTYLNITGDTHIYFWINSSIAIDTKANGGVRLRVTDSAGNYEEWWVGGSEDYFGGWQCYVIYTGTSPAASSGTLNRSQIRYLTYYLKVTGKTTVNAANVWLDIAYYGNGLVVKGGTSGDKGTFQQVLDADATPAYGVMAKKYGAFVLQGPITFGDSTGATTTYFSDSSQIVIFAQADVSSTHYAINIVGNSTGTNSVQFGSVTGSGSAMVGSEGVVFKSASTSLPFSFNAANANVNELKLYGNLMINASTINIGSTSTALGGSGSTIHLVDNSFQNPTQLVRNISGSATQVLLRNSIVSANNTSASINLYDTAATSSDELTVIEGAGFQSTATATTIDITGEAFPNTSTNKPYLTIQDSASAIWNLNNVSDGIGGRISVTDQTELAFAGTANGDVNENFTVTWKVEEPDGTDIGTARVKIIETAPAVAIANEDSTDGSGDASSTYLRALYEPSGADTITTTTHTPAAYKVYKYGYLPYVASATINAAVTNNVALLDDSFQSETTASTARTLGDTTNTVAIEQQTNPASIIKYTGGSGTLAVTNTVTGGTSGTTGVVVEIIEGDSTAGTIILDTRGADNYTAAGESLSNGAGWSATMTASSETRYQWLIDADSLTMQELYDYMMAKLEEDPLDTASPSYMDDVILWGRAEHGTPVQGSGTKFKTVRNVALTEGWAVYNTSLGGVAFYTADDGTTFIPQLQVDITITAVDTANDPIETAQVAVYDSSDDSVLMNELTNASGIATESYQYGGSPINIYARIRKSTSGSTRYYPVETTGSITASGFSATVTMRVDTVAES